jgi:hypothetical protein
MQGKFVDPNLPAGFALFGIAALNGNLYVTFRDCTGKIRLSTRGCADRQFWRWNDKHLSRTTVFYAAGFADQTDGVFGGITVSSSPTPIGY